MGPGLKRLPRQRKVVVPAAIVAILVLALVITMVVRSRTPQPPDQQIAEPGPGDRVLQSVDVAMQTDGALSGVGDTVVISRAQGGDSASRSTTYDPSQVVDDLPVRVLTAYRTDTGSGTNLADLKGHTGRVQIDLTVQNLTVASQQVHYDVAGRARTSTAMVGAPLTVVASAALPGVSPAEVVTSSADPEAVDDTTNGVLSRAQDNTTQVQWATILAPPQLDASATLRLVVDAKDFTLPSIDLSVQPGLVTDPSLGALVDAAFDPKSSGELDLQSRTLKLVGDVNEVLVRANSTVADVRKNLSTTSKTFGTKTVSSLKTNTTQISSSLKSSDADLRSLGKDLKSSLEATNSSTLASLSSTVDQLDQVLGDTSVKQPTPTTTGAGCAQVVAAPGTGDSVYGALLQVTAQLDAYAASSAACKVELQGIITKTIGVENPTDCDPAAFTSVTCSMLAAGSTYTEIAAQLSAGQAASAGLDPDNLNPITAQLTALGDQLDDIKTATDTLRTPPDPPTDPEPTLTTVGKALSAAADSATALSKAVEEVRSDALEGAATVESLRDQNADLAEQLCDLVGAGPGKLSAAQVETLRSYIATHSCPVDNAPTVKLTPPAKYGAAMEDRLKDQAATFADIAAQTDTSKTTAGVGLPLAELRAQLAAAGAALTVGDGSLRARVDALNTALAAAGKDLDTLEASLGQVQTSYATAKTGLDKALTEGQQTTSQATAGTATEVKTIVDRGKADSDQLGKAFTDSAAGLTSAAKTLRENGAKTIDEQRKNLDTTGDQAEASLSSGMKSALTRVSNDVSSSTRDLESTRTQLNRDLTNILLDLGNPKVQGSGVIGGLATSAKVAGSADFQLSLAADQTSAYSAVRARDLSGVLLRQAQAEAALQRQADLPAFATPLPPTVEHRTVYVFHLAGGR